MILVTGAAGHLGNVLVRELVAHGGAVRAFILPGEDRSSLAGLEVEFIEGNILDPHSLDIAMQGIEVVYHMAALVSISTGQEALLHRVNVDGTRNVIEAAHRAGVRRLVYTSSIHALARPPEGIAIDESMPFDIHNPAGPYDQTKAEASLIAKEAATLGQDVVIVCPTGVIGPFDYRRSEMGEMILDWMGKKINFIITGFFDFVDVRDVAHGHILAAEKGRSGEAYILGGERISLDALVRQVKGFARSKAPFITVPVSVALFATNFTQWYYQATHTRPRFTRYALETVTSNSKISSQKASRELGYTPRSLTETLRDTVLWWIEHKLLIKPSLRV
jgi:dihydroflavonol-4-reductase